MVKRKLVYGGSSPESRTSHLGGHVSKMELNEIYNAVPNKFSRPKIYPKIGFLTAEGLESGEDWENLVESDNKNVYITDKNENRYEVPRKYVKRQKDYPNRYD